jgi:hypothetical protein
MEARAVAIAGEWAGMPIIVCAEDEEGYRASLPTMLLA